MNDSTFSVLTEMILQDAKAYVARGDNSMAIKLWRYSMTFEKKYKQIEKKMNKINYTKLKLTL